MRACLFAILLSACTQWATTPIYGQQTEVGRRLMGSPQVEETSSSEIQGGFSTFGESYQGRHYGAESHIGGLSGSHESSKRVHCVQQAQIDYVQPVDYDTHIEHRPYDVAGSVALGLAGLGIIAAAEAQYGSAESFYEMDPSFFAKPSQPTLAYGIGGAALVGAVVWIGYSLTQLPKGNAPSVAPTRRAWTETTYVEAEGCGLVPADRR